MRWLPVSPMGGFLWTLKSAVQALVGVSMRYCQKDNKILQAIYNKQSIFVFLCELPHIGSGRLPRRPGPGNCSGVTQMFHVEQPARYLRLRMRDSWIGVSLGGGRSVHAPGTRLGFRVHGDSPSRQDVMGPEGPEVRPCCARPPPRDVGAIPARARA